MSDYCSKCDSEDCKCLTPYSVNETLSAIGAEEGREAPPEAPDAPLSLSPRVTRLTATGAPEQPPQIASDLRILDNFKGQLAVAGVVGEVATAATVYLAITSRILEKPISIVVKGNSSSGKSFVVQETAKFFPPEAMIAMTAMSEKALIYMKEDFSHRTLIVYEAAALKEGAAAQRDDQTSYFIRSLISEGRIDYPVTVRDKDGGFITKHIVKEGPTGLIITTTATRLHGENETRLLSLPTNDSREQTQRVLLQIAEESENAPDLHEWLQLQRWLQSDAEKRVVIPFARTLAELIPPVAIRLRRDFSVILNLVRSHAVLHQLNRARDDDGRVIATLDDYEVIYELVAHLVAEGVGATVSSITRETVGAVEALSGSSPQGVMALALAQKLDLDKSTARRRLLVAKDAGFVRNLEEKRGQPGRWAIHEPLPDEVGVMPTPHAVRGGKPVASGGAGVATGISPITAGQSPNRASGGAVARYPGRERRERGVDCPECGHLGKFHHWRKCSKFVEEA